MQSPGVLTFGGIPVAERKHEAGGVVFWGYRFETAGLAREVIGLFPVGAKIAVAGLDERFWVVTARDGRELAAVGVNEV